MENQYLINTSKLNSTIKMAGLSKKEICDSVEIPYVTLRRWTKGEVTKVRIKNLEKLAATLNCEIAELVDQSAINEPVLPPKEFGEICDELEDSNYFNTMLANCWQSGLLIFKALVRPNMQRTAKLNLYYWLSIFYYVNGKLKKTEDILTKISKMYKSEEEKMADGRFFITNGMIGLYKDDPETEYYYKKAIELNQDSPFYKGWVEVHLAAFFMNNKRYEEAKLYCLNAISTADKVRFHSQKAQIKGVAYILARRCSDYLGLFEAADQYYQSSIPFIADSNFGKLKLDAEINRAHYLAIRGRIQEAVVIFENTITKYPFRDVYFANSLAVGMEIFYLAEQPRKARLLYDEAKENNLGMIGPLENLKNEFDNKIRNKIARRS